MSWGKIITFIVALALVVGGAIYAYRVFSAPEPVTALTEKWTASGHADATSESFVHWDEDDPPEVPTACAKCHSLYGYLDWMGADGTAFREVDSAAEIGSVLYCNTCHNDATHATDDLVFPSGVEVTDQGWSANCQRCHQGRTWTGTVDDRTAGLDADEVSEDLSFINVHYRIAAATRWGGETMIGYQYDGADYVGFYPHVEEYDECNECHDPHSTRIDPATCEPCHSNVVNYGDMFDIREGDTDFDGDGDVDEGIGREVDELHATLYEAIQAYAADVIGTPIVYAPSFPYWMIDTDGDGEADEDEVSGGNSYSDWTPRLVRTTYNYHYVVEDPGAFAHNAAYVMQLLYDAAADLGEVVEVDLSPYTRPTGFD